MYKPYFTITPKISKNIEEIGKVLGYLKAISLPPNYQKKYIARVIADTVHSSTSIEGNTLTKSQVKEVLEGKEVNAQEKEVREVESYFKAVTYIRKTAKVKIITEKVIFNIHKIILSQVGKKEVGVYRRSPIYVGDYVPPNYKKVPILMKGFIEWMNNPNPKDLSPILYAAITHYKFVAIHPFGDGNGRTARILTKLMLIRYGYDITRYFSLESFYNRNRINYYSALNNVDKYRKDGREDLTGWLAYFTEGMFVEAKRGQAGIDELKKQSAFISKPVALDEKQKNLLQFLKKKKTLKTHDYIKFTGLSRKGAYNSLEKLVKAGLLKRLGAGKGSYYSLTDEGLKYV